MSRRKKYIESCQVSEIKTYTLHGYPQKILLEGKNAAAPIILYLHGGPGSPIPFCAGSRGLFPAVTDEFIMVYWDQLGCGMNDHPIDDSFSLDDYVSMTLDLILAIHKDFPDNPINLFGVSWGSILAAHAAARLPGLVSRAVVYGQVTKDLFFNEEVFDRLEFAHLNGKERAEVRRLKALSAKDQKDIMSMAGLIRRHTEGYAARDGGKTPMGKIMFGLLTSPDYTLRDFKAVMVNGTRQNQSLYRELLRVDLRDTLKSIKVPYFILQGDTDIVTSTRFIRTFVEETGNQNLSLSIVPHSGHMPGGEGMAYIIEKGFDLFREQNDK